MNRGLGDDVAPTERTTVLAGALHDDETADAEDVAAAQADGLEGDGEADGAEVVGQLGDDGQEVLLDGEAGGLGEVVGEEAFVAEEAGEEAAFLAGV